MILKKMISADGIPVCESVPFCMLLAIAGGFLDAYTFVGRGGVFCNAQTGNIVLLGVYCAEKNWSAACRHIPPILAFATGVFCVEALKDEHSPVHCGDWRKFVLYFESCILFLIGLIPTAVPDVIITASVSFAASVQVSSFRKLAGSQFNTTMSTGNLRSAMQAFYQAVIRHDTEAAKRSRRYFIIILSFLSGALAGSLLTSLLGVRAVWCAIFLLLCASVLYQKRSFL